MAPPSSDTCRIPIGTTGPVKVQNQMTCGIPRRGPHHPRGRHHATSQSVLRHFVASALGDFLAQHNVPPEQIQRPKFKFCGSKPMVTVISFLC
jgi:hypothetical protein